MTWNEFMDYTKGWKRKDFLEFLEYIETLRIVWEDEE